MLFSKPELDQLFRNRRDDEGSECFKHQHGNMVFQNKIFEKGEECGHAANRNHTVQTVEQRAFAFLPVILILVRASEPEEEYQ